MILLRVKYIYLIIMEILSKGIPFRQYSSNWNEMRTFPTCTLQVNFQWKLGYQNCCFYILLKCILMLKQIYYLFIAYHFPFIKSYFNHYYPLNSVFLKGNRFQNLQIQIFAPSQVVLQWALYSNYYCQIP